MLTRTVTACLLVLVAAPAFGSGASGATSTDGKSTTKSSACLCPAGSKTPDESVRQIGTSLRFGDRER